MAWTDHDDTARGTAPAFISMLPITALAVLFVLDEVPWMVDGPNTTMATAMGVMTFVVAGVWHTVGMLGRETSLLSVFLWSVRASCHTHTHTHTHTTTTTTTATTTPLHTTTHNTTPHART